MQKGLPKEPLSFKIIDLTINLIISYFAGKSMIFLQKLLLVSSKDT